MLGEGSNSFAVSRLAERVQRLAFGSQLVHQCLWSAEKWLYWIHLSLAIPLQG
jgi:hypothetical protein